MAQIPLKVIPLEHFIQLKFCLSHLFLVHLVLRGERFGIFVYVSQGQRDVMK